MPDLLKEKRNEDKLDYRVGGQVRHYSGTTEKRRRRPGR
jgi:hypothetical protein